MKIINLFETFAGIGSQYQALKNLEKELNFKTVSLGVVEWYIDAIISYEIIHKGIKKPETKLSKNEMVEKLKNFSFSSDSKLPVSEKYFSRIFNDKLSNIFPYLKSFIDKRERERERELFTK